MNTEVPMSIRMVTRRDYNELLAIEQKSFLAPMTRGELGDWVRRDDTVCLVYEVHDTVVGYMLYMMGQDQYLIYGLAVDPVYRFQGVASELVGHLKLGLLGNKSKIFVSLRSTWLPAIQFFKKQGFRLFQVATIDGSRDKWMRYCFK